MDALSVLLLVFVWLLNFGISWWNARAVGSAWAYGKVAGGMVRLLLWSGGIMSAAGFTWCYLIVLALAAGSFEMLPWEYVQGALELGYLILIGPILASGLVITIHSWKRAWEERSLLGYGLAGWNTFAQVHNTVSAFRNVPPALEHVGKLFKGSGKGSGKGKAAVAMVLLVILALIGGILTTVMIARGAARKNSEHILDRIREQEQHA